MHTIRKTPDDKYVVIFGDAVEKNADVPMYVCDDAYIAVQICAVLNGYRLQDSDQWDHLMQSAREVIPQITVIIPPS